MANPIEFMKPRLVGERFEGHAIPFEVLKDLSVLEELLVEAAKWQYRNSHSGRQRVPRGFADGVSLQLTAVEDGSAIPVITLCIAASTGVLGPDFSDSFEYFTKARDEIVATVSAAEKDSPLETHLPDNLLSYFDRLGRSLREGEAIEFSPKTPQAPARLNRRTRKKILLASKQLKEFTEEIAIRGVVSEMDQERMGFEFQPIGSSRTIPGVISQEHFDSILEAFNGYRDGAKVLIRGVGCFNRSETLVKIESIESLSLLDENDVGARLDEIRSLKRGWFNGKGRALDPEGLDWLASQLDQFFPEDLPTPFLYPTPEGGVQIEWTIGSDEISVDVDLKNHTAWWHRLNLANDVEDEKPLNLGDQESWYWLGREVSSEEEGVSA